MRPGRTAWRVGRVLAFRVLPLLVLLEAGLQLEWMARGHARHEAPSGPGFRIAVLGNSMSEQYVGRLRATLHRPGTGAPIIVDDVTVGALAPAGLIQELQRYLDRSPPPDVVIAMMGLSERGTPAPRRSWHLLTWTLLRDTWRRLWRHARPSPGSEAVERALSERGLSEPARIEALSTALQSCDDMDVCLRLVWARCPAVLTSDRCDAAVAALAARLAGSRDVRRLASLAEVLSNGLGRDHPVALGARLAVDRLRGDADDFLDQVEVVVSRAAVAGGVYLWERLTIIQTQWFADAQFSARLESSSRHEGDEARAAWRIAGLARRLEQGDFDAASEDFSSDPVVRRAVFEFQGDLARRDTASADALVDALVRGHPHETALFWTHALRGRMEAEGASAALEYLDARLASPEWQALLAAGRTHPFSGQAVSLLAAAGRCDEARELAQRTSVGEIHGRGKVRTSVEGVCSSPDGSADAPAIASSRSNDELRAAYERLGELADQYGFDVIAMQYPTWPLAELEKRLPPGYKMRLVDNEAAFRRAVEEHGRLAVFSDFAGGTFGHLTDLGLDVLMEDLVPVVHEVVRQRDTGNGVAASGTPNGGDGP